ncbi:hypothetical protein T484DRAFT_1878864 [Baffinella frigidus]|nr:hypothetical protein T484DRAFT_1878864 [Cryptophyta sp. CCMP2293]
MSSDKYSADLRAARKSLASIAGQARAKALRSMMAEALTADDASFTTFLSLLNEKKTLAVEQPPSAHSSAPSSPRASESSSEQGPVQRWGISWLRDRLVPL